MDKDLEINIDMELGEARKGAYEAIADSSYWIARSAARTAAYMTSEIATWSARNSVWAAVDYKEEKLKQLEMIKEIL